MAGTWSSWIRPPGKFASGQVSGRNKVRIDNCFSVFLLGFSEYDQRLFGSIAPLTKGRTRSYRLIESSPGKADIFIVNGDDEDAVQAWENQRHRARAIPAVIVSESSSQRRATVHLRRPLVLTRVISALDQVALEDLQFAPDLVIEDGAEVPQELNETIKRMASHSQRGTTQRALVVDGCESVLKLMEIQLRISGMAGDFTASAGKAWEMLTKNKYDIVFLEATLPDVDGYRICKSIKSHQGLKHIPVVMLTGKASTVDRVRGKMAGCDAYLIKPVPHEALRKVIQRHLPAVSKAAPRPIRESAKPALAGAR